MPDQAKIDELMKAKKYNELGPYTTTGKYFEGAAPLAKAIKAELDKSGHQAARWSATCRRSSPRGRRPGDIEYLFAVNATYDETEGTKRTGLKATTAKLRLPGRPPPPVYDAWSAAPVAEFKKQPDGDKSAASSASAPARCASSPAPPGRSAASGWRRRWCAAT